MRKLTYLNVILILFVCGAWAEAYGQDGWGSVAIGLSGGVSKLEGDLQKPQISPSFSANIHYFLNPYFGLGMSAGYANLTSSDEEEKLALTWDKTTAVPLDAELKFRLFPFHSICPYAAIGASGIYWKSDQDDTTTIYDGFDAFLKTGGGIELRLSKQMRLDIGASFHYGFLDDLDNRKSGNEDDGIIDAHLGLTYYFPTGNKYDLDRDGVPNELDLDFENSEDGDGYMDHDGIPEDNPDVSVYYEYQKSQSEEDADSISSEIIIPSTSPVLIHYPIRIAEEHQKLGIRAFAYHTDSLKACAALYRTRSELNWQLMQLKAVGSRGFQYKGTIPGEVVTPDGLEYFVVAVDKEVTGIGYSGLPARPLHVRVYKNPKKWRIMGGTLAALTWGAASYIILKKQN